MRINLYSKGLIVAINIAFAGITVSSALSIVQEQQNKLGMFTGKGFNASLGLQPSKNLLQKKLKLKEVVITGKDGTVFTYGNQKYKIQKIKKRKKKKWEIFSQSLKPEHYNLK